MNIRAVIGSGVDCAARRLMIGCIGIGGVILVPALVFLAGLAIQIAIPAAMFAYILSGWWRLLYSPAINRSTGEWRVRYASAAAAFARAWAVSVFDGRLLTGCLGLLAFLTGLNSLLQRIHADTDDAKLSKAFLFVIGVVTGSLSSLTGTLTTAAGCTAPD